MAPKPNASKSSGGGRVRGRGKRTSLVVETESTDSNTDSVSNAEKMRLQYPNLPKGKFLIQYQKTNKIHMKDKVQLLLTVTKRNLTPDTEESMLDWLEANPNVLLNPRPNSSAVHRTFLVASHRRI